MDDWLLTFLPVIALGANALTQVAMLHLVSSTKVARSVVVGILAGVGMLGAGFVVLEGSVVQAFVAAVTYLAFSFGYFAFLNLNITSLRIRMLRDLLNAGEGGLTRGELCAQYDASEMLSRRLQRMLAGGQLQLRNGKYVIGKPHFLFIARLIDAVRGVILPRHLHPKV